MGLEEAIVATEKELKERFPRVGGLRGFGAVATEKELKVRNGQRLHTALAGVATEKELKAPIFSQLIAIFKSPVATEKELKGRCR